MMAKGNTVDEGMELVYKEKKGGGRESQGQKVKLMNDRKSGMKQN